MEENQKKLELSHLNLMAFKYAITGKSMSEEAEAAMYIIHHYGHMNPSDIAEKLEKRLPENGKCHVDVVEALVNGFREGQRYSQLEAMK